MLDPCISIDRDARQFAIFDGIECRGPFRPYTDEAEALRLARAEIALLTNKEPEVVYPSITSMRITTRRSRR